jgi:hypothetical protein
MKKEVTEKPELVGREIWGQRYGVRPYNLHLFPTACEM